MKIVLFDYVFERDKPGITGLSDLVWNWAKHLVALGDEVHIVAPYLESAQPPEGTIVHRFPVPPIGYRNIVGHILIVLRGWLEIRKLGKVDIIHAPEYLSTGIFALLTRDTPVVLTVPGNIYERIEHGNPFDWSATQAFKVAARLSASLCARIIVTSEEMRRWWGKTGTPTSRMVLIPYGVDTDLFRPIPGARALLGISDHKRIVLYVGRLSHEKGIHHLLGAVHGVNKDIPGVELHLVGDGRLKGYLAQLARQLQIEEQVIFHGWVDQPDLPLYYSAADVTVLPSLSEGLPRTMLEAMACGSPFLGTKITGIVDHVRDGETAFLVKSADTAALSTSLIHILTTPQHARKVAQQGRSYVLDHLSWKRVMADIRTHVYLPVAVGRER
jgi:glycosyltransferase involved in cell wall biosynthesis